MLIPLELVSFAVDPRTNAPMIILKEARGERTLAVPITPLEANAIAIKTLNVDTERPLTADLLKAVLESLGGRLQKVVISDIENQIWFSRIHVISGHRVYVYDCRPSDAVALALRCGAPLFVRDRVFDKISPPDEMSEDTRLRRAVSSRDTLAFGTHYLEF